MTDATPNRATDTRGPAARPWRLIRRGLILIVGVPVTLLGVALLVAPGPGTPILIAGLAILATEFQWAQRQVDRLRKMARKVMGRTRTTQDV